MTTTYLCNTCGQQSSDADFCSECGAAINATPAADSSAPQVSAPAAGQIECPSCKTLNEADSVFCINCGLDFANGALPDGAAAQAQLAQPNQDSAAAVQANVPISSDGNAGTSAALADPNAPPVVLAVEPDKIVAGQLVVKVHYDLARQPITENPTLPAGPDERTFSTTDAQFTVGRRKNTGRPNIELSEDIGVSRDHGKFVYFQDGWHYVDHSTNGTKINGIDAKRDQLIALSVKDVIKLGDWSEIEVLQV